MPDVPIARAESPLPSFSLFPPPFVSLDSYRESASKFIQVNLGGFRANKNCPRQLLDETIETGQDSSSGERFENARRT